MKKFIAYACLFLPLVLFVSGCEKEEDSPIIMENPKITLEVSNSNPEYLGTSTVTWYVTGKYKAVSVSVNGVVISTENKGNKQLINLTEKQVIIVTCSTVSGGEAIINRKEINPKDEEVTVSPPDFSFSLSPDSLEYGGGIVRIDYIATNTTTLIFQDQAISNSGFVNIRVEKTDTVSFFATGTSVIEFEVIIPVKTPGYYETILSSFSYFRVVGGLESTFSPDGPWTIREIDYGAPCVADDKWSFSLLPNRMSHDMATLCSGGIAPPLTWEFTISGDILYCGDTWFILKFDDPTNLEWIQPGQRIVNGVSTPIWIKEQLLGVQ